MTTHMRRAVAACTSPEVFFGAGVSGATGDSVLLANNLAPTDPLGLAMERLDL
jgi:alpha,alpha-trehalase